jgi:hypothetical protein
LELSLGQNYKEPDPNATLSASSSHLSFQYRWYQS